MCGVGTNHYGLVGLCEAPVGCGGYTCCGCGSVVSENSKKYTHGSWCKKPRLVGVGGGNNPSRLGSVMGGVVGTVVAVGRNHPSLGALYKRQG